MKQTLLRHTCIDLLSLGCCYCNLLSCEYLLLWNLGIIKVHPPLSQLRWTSCKSTYLHTHTHACIQKYAIYIHIYINTHVHVLHMYISYATTSRHTAAHLAYFLPSAITFFILHPTVLPLPPSLILSLILPLCQALQIIIPSDNVTLTATQQARDADSSRLPQLPHIQIQIQI